MLLILDAGCGNGVNLFGVSASLIDIGLGVGLDISEFQVKEAARHSRRFNVNNAEFIVGDINKLPFRSRSLDLCGSFGTLTPTGGMLCTSLKAR